MFNLNVVMSYIVLVSFELKLKVCVFVGLTACDMFMYRH